MSTLNLAGFAGLAQNRSEAAPAAGARKEREEAKVWLNFGYPKTWKNPDTGQDEVTFVSLARGIPLDQIEDFDLTKVNRSTMATLRRDQNRFRAALMEQAAQIKPGESKIISFDETTGLGIELRVRGEGAAPIEDEPDAPAPFSFR